MFACYIPNLPSKSSKDSCFCAAGLLAFVAAPSRSAFPRLCAFVRRLLSLFISSLASSGVMRCNALGWSSWRSGSFANVLDESVVVSEGETVCSAEVCGVFDCILTDVGDD